MSENQPQCLRAYKHAPWGDGGRLRAILASAPVKEGTRNGTNVHSQPPARRGSIGSLLVSTWFCTVQEKLRSLIPVTDQDEVQRRFRFHAIRFRFHDRRSTLRHLRNDLR